MEKLYPTSLSQACGVDFLLLTLFVTFSYLQRHHQKLEIVKLDTISPFLGEQFTKSLMLLALFVFIAVSITILFKYRKIKLTLAVILTMFSEVFLTLGIAALIRWNLDAPSIAGIIAGIGTGVNDQIVIIDESVSQKTIGVKERVRRALF